MSIGIGQHGWIYCIILLATREESKQQSMLAAVLESLLKHQCMPTGEQERAVGEIRVELRMQPYCAHRAVSNCEGALWKHHPH